MNRNLLRPLAITAAILSAAACSRQAPPAAKPAAAVAARTAERRTVAASVVLTGTVEPERTARLTAQVDGDVERLNVREGDAVRTGQVLVRIDPSRIQAALDEARADEMAAQADLADARRVLERDRLLFDRQGIGRERLEGSETGVQRLEAALLRTRARIAGLEAQRVDTEVRAPFEGYVLERWVELGDVVKNGSPLVSVASRPVRVVVSVSERDLGRLRPGDGVRLSIHEADEAIPGRIARIRPQVDPTTRTAAVEVLPEADGRRLLPGMMLMAAFTLDQRDGVVAVPAEAVLVRPNGDRHVFVVEGESAALRKVRTGLEGGGWVEVAEGIAAGETVVVQGQERLKDGSPVKVKKPGGGVR